MRIDVISAVPKILFSPLNESIIKRAADKKLAEINIHDLRDYATGKYRQVDDRPFGGEAGNSDGFMINKTYIKFWPAEYHSQSAIDAGIKLHAKLGGDLSRVAHIDIHTFEASYNIIGKL